MPDLGEASTSLSAISPGFFALVRMLELTNGNIKVANIRVIRNHGIY